MEVDVKLKKETDQSPAKSDVMYSTPITDTGQSSLDVVQSIDSGFAEGCHSDDPSSSLDSSLDWQVTPVYVPRPSKHKRRSRRLQFDERPPSFHHLTAPPPSPEPSEFHEDEFIEETIQISLNHTEFEKLQRIEIENTKAEDEDNNEIHTRSEVLVAKHRPGVATTFSSLSSSTEELELSLQEMSLEESSSSSLMSVGSNPCLSRPGSAGLFRPHSASPRFGRTISSQILGRSASEGSQTDFLRALSLSRKNASHALSTHKTDGDDSALASENNSFSEAVNLEPRVPPLPHEYFLLDNLSADDEVTDVEDDMVFSPINKVGLSCVKSPTKRCCGEDSKQYELLLPSPLKARRKESTDSPEVTFINDASSLNIQTRTRSFGRHLSDKFSAVDCERSPQFYSTSSTFDFTPSAEIFKQTRTDTTLPEPTVVSTIEANLIKTLLAARPSEHLAQTKDDLLDSVHQRRLQEVIATFSPKEPSRLIGRHMGLARMDIVGELQTQGFVMVVRQILRCLESVDLMRVSVVSKTWKCAVLGDPWAGCRHRAWTEDKACRRKDRGKENLKETTKSLSPASASQALTPSKGHLTSRQPQVVVPFNLDQGLSHTQPPPKIDLQWDDHLRNCPRCQGQAKVIAIQDRATCVSEKCGFDFCTLCFSEFHFSQACKPLCRALSRNEVAGTRKSKKNLRRL